MIAKITSLNEGSATLDSTTRAVEVEKYQINKRFEKILNDCIVNIKQKNS